VVVKEYLKVVVFKDKTLLYLIVGGLILNLLTSILLPIINLKDQDVYSKDEVELMLKHQAIEIEASYLKKENEIIEKDNERIKENIGSDSTIIFDSSRAFRDSIRRYIFNQ